VVELKRLVSCILLAVVVTAIPCFGNAQSQIAVPAPVPQRIATTPFIVLPVRLFQPSLPDIGTTILPNQQVAGFMMRPQSLVVLKAPTLRNPRAFPSVLSTGTPLFQVQVDDGGAAFCAFWTVGQGERETQCLRDVNSDGTFDAAYTTRNVFRGESLYIGQLTNLAAIAAAPYEALAQSEVAPEPFTYRFLRIRNGAAEFKPQFGSKKKGFAVKSCPLIGSERCILGSYAFEFEAQGAGLKVVSVTPINVDVRLLSER
jgi:hypothetical protein